jgi:hypothetical protein
MLILIALLLLQPALTIEDCVLKSGYSTRITEPAQIAALSGTESWAAVGVDALTDGQVIGVAGVETDTGRRRVHFIAYDAAVYAFVYMHADDPDSGREDGAWHGDCFLKIGETP